MKYQNEVWGIESVGKVCTLNIRGVDTTLHNERVIRFILCHRVSSPVLETLSCYRLSLDLEYQDYVLGEEKGEG